MDGSTDPFDQLDEYLDGQLDRPSRERFDAQLGTDPALARALAQQQELRLLLQRPATRDAVSAMHSRLRAAGRLDKPARLPGWRYPAGGMLLVLLALFGWWWYQAPATGDEALYHAFYAPERVSMGASDCPATFDPGVAQYRAGHYADALKTLPNDTSGCSAYYRGLTLLALDKADEAEPLLRRARQLAPPLLRPRADWYEALALTRLGQHSAAQALLRPMTSQYEHPHQADAQRLLQRFDTLP